MKGLLMNACTGFNGEKNAVVIKTKKVRPNTKAEQKQFETRRRIEEIKDKKRLDAELLSMSII